MIQPLDWRELAYEATRRRKVEGLTQESLANLAGVSRATVIAVERGETSIRLDKALEILRVLGLAVIPDSGGDQDAFVRLARERWQELISPLPPRAPARHPHGYMAFDYELTNVPAFRPPAFLKALQQAAVHQSGWPPFWVPRKEALRPTIQDGFVECWLGRPNIERLFDDPAHTDFWRASPAGRLYLQRGYQEDGPDVLEPGTILDLTLPIWRCGEILLHAQSLAQVVADKASTARLRVRFASLSGREMVSWAKPSRRHESLGLHRSRTDDVVTTISTEAASIKNELPALIHRWLTPLYDRFGFALPSSLVEQEVADLLSPSRRLKSTDNSDG